MVYVLAKVIPLRINIVLVLIIRKKVFVVVVYMLNSLSPKYKESKRFKVEQKSPRFSSFKLERNISIRYIPVTCAST